jgi:hypothetical protein
MGVVSKNDLPTGRLPICAYDGFVFSENYLNIAGQSSFTFDEGHAHLSNLGLRNPMPNEFITLVLDSLENRVGENLARTYSNMKSHGKFEFLDLFVMNNGNSVHIFEHPRHMRGISENKYDCTSMLPLEPIIFPIKLASKQAIPFKTIHKECPELVNYFFINFRELPESYQNSATLYLPNSSLKLPLAINPRTLDVRYFDTAIARPLRDLHLPVVPD